MRQDLFYLLVLFLAEVLRVLAFFADAFGWRRSGSTFLPVERFHSSYWSSVILPSTSSCANFRRCALLLKGIKQRLANASAARGQAGPRWSASFRRRTPAGCSHLVATRPGCRQAIYCGSFSP